MEGGRKGRKKYRYGQPSLDRREREKGVMNTPKPQLEQNSEQTLLQMNCGSGTEQALTTHPHGAVAAQQGWRCGGPSLELAYGGHRWNVEGLQATS